MSKTLLPLPTTELISSLTSAGVELPGMISGGYDLLSSAAGRKPEVQALPLTFSTGQRISLGRYLPNRELYSFMSVNHSLQIGYFVHVGWHKLWQIVPESLFLILKYDLKLFCIIKSDEQQLIYLVNPVYLHNTYFTMQLANCSQCNKDKHYLAI